MCASFTIADGEDLGAKTMRGVDNCNSFFMHHYVCAAKVMNCCASICSCDVNYSLANVKQLILLNITLKAQFSLIALEDNPLYVEKRKRIVFIYLSHQCWILMVESSTRLSLK